MKKEYGLTKTEMQIMELLWDAQKPMSFREIMNVAMNEWNKTWKAQTLNTFLLGLQKMGLVGRVSLQYILCPMYKRAAYS